MLVLCISHENVRRLSYVSIHSPDMVRAAPASSRAHMDLSRLHLRPGITALLAFQLLWWETLHLHTRKQNGVNVRHWDDYLQVSLLFERETSWKFWVDFTEISLVFYLIRDEALDLSVALCVAWNSFTDATFCLFSLFFSRKRSVCASWIILVEYFFMVFSIVPIIYLFVAKYVKCIRWTVFDILNFLAE